MSYGREKRIFEEVLAEQGINEQRALPELDKLVTDLKSAVSNLQSISKETRDYPEVAKWAKSQLAKAKTLLNDAQEMAL